MGVCSIALSGLDYPKTAIVTRTLGWMPNSIVIIALPQGGAVPADGTLILNHGGNIVSVPQLRIDSFNVRLSTAGHIVYIRALDRRWKWRYRLVSGRYNVRLADGTIDPLTQKTTQQLASILLNAMGEPGSDVSQLPNDGYPEVDWSYDIAALELAQVCAARGCDISYNMDDTVSIVRLGEGALLPDDGDLQTVSVAFNPSRTPGKIIFVCGETQYQSLLKLIAVGEDLDGTIKPINSLSYKPPSGWESVAQREDFEDINTENLTALSPAQVQRAKQLARRSVYRWYAVEKQADDTMNVPDYGPIDDISQILPINDFLLDTQTAATGNSKINKSAKVYGTYLTADNPDQVKTTDPLTEYQGQFSISKASGVVKFSKPVVKLDSDGKIHPADLYLETSYGVRSNTDRQSERNVVTRFLQGDSSLSAAVRYEEIALSVVASYTGNSPPQVSGTETNESEVEYEANSILNALEQRYSNVVYGHGRYRDLKQIGTDGAIRQVMWSLDDVRGANTVLVRNSECLPWVPRVEERERRRLLASQETRESGSNWQGRRGREAGIYRRGGYQP